MNYDSAITRLFERYGFRPGYSSNPQTHAVFTIRSGYFHQAEILILDGRDQAAIEVTRLQLENSGFACHSRIFSNVNDLETRLFQGFFGVD